jgi:hypothetical protein
MEALDLIIKFRKYKAYEHAAIREFYSLLRAGMMGARKAQLLRRFINNQMLPGIMARMPLGDWKQWAKERPQWIQGSREEAFWKFKDPKWRDSLNVAAAEPAMVDFGAELKRTVTGSGKDHCGGRGKRRSRTHQGKGREGPEVQVFGNYWVHWLTRFMAVQSFWGQGPRGKKQDH